MGPTINTIYSFWKRLKKWCVSGSPTRHRTMNARKYVSDSICPDNTFEPVVGSVTLAERGVNEND